MVDDFHNTRKYSGTHSLPRDTIPTQSWILPLSWPLLLQQILSRFGKVHRKLFWRQFVRNGHGDELGYFCQNSFSEPETMLVGLASEPDLENTWIWLGPVFLSFSSTLFVLYKTWHHVHVQTPRTIFSSFV